MRKCIRALLLRIPFEGCGSEADRGREQRQQPGFSFGYLEEV
jgi:hypothetical protein